MIEEIRRQVSASGPFIQLMAVAQSLQKDRQVQIQGISGSLMAFVVAYLFELQHTQLLLVVPDKDRAEQLQDDCSLLLGESAVHLFASGPTHAAKLLDMSATIAQVETLRALSSSDLVLIIATAEALTTKLPPIKQFTENIIELEVSKECQFEQLLQKLVAVGFEKKDFVEEYGDFAVRGGILDVFPFVGDNPIRFEFWGDTIESIREFDVLSQRSIRELQSASVVANVNSASAGSFQTSHNPDAGDTQVSLFEYLSPNAIILFDEPLLIEKEIDELFKEGHQNIFDWKTLKEKSIGFPHYIHSSVRSLDSPIDINFNSISQPSLGGSVKRLIDQFENLASQGYTLFVACDTKEESGRLNELIEEELTAPDEPVVSGRQSAVVGRNDNIDQHNAQLQAFSPTSPVSYQILPEALHSGFIFSPAKIVIFTEHEIFSRLKRRGPVKRKKFKGFTQKEFLQVHRGDYVVHQDYGIGRFAGLQKIKIRGIETEAIKLVYEGNDVLYVHLNFINRVQKYSSQEGHAPKLRKLGAPDWERLKTRARKKIKDIARDLIKLYARRKHEQGFSFAPDTHWQKEMEASFQYEDTADQAKTTLDIKQDMEQPSPMDRLICGDVGFGKTEVAVRAAFKAVMSGKQVAVLVPTTILARQHLHTFLDRIGRYSVSIELLTRFRSKKDQTEMLRALSEGKVDIVIGTHRLLSKDVVFKNIGLLIIDEEQRFGVAAKEKLRQLRASVDTLALTATPIPRTLQFSLMGARDLSLINTPPRNRIPIQTEIAQFDIQVIREAIMKELYRGGQVYFVHDRVHNIGLIQSMLEEHIPKARFHIAHGQMKGHELEKTMLNFLEKKYDVLICTKIIESGIDIPSVNTIIINRADRFGLAELYQLRGRVGRSNVQAYAFLLVPPLSVLPRITLRRLQAIQEFTELGSGFNLAMRDLEIRGAGNLLGGEQSGFILEMGFEMYQRIVEEAVAELKEEEFKELVEGEIGVRKQKGMETVIEFDIEALIPDLYIEQDNERLDIYRRLYKCELQEDINAMRAELQDRFGEYPPEVEYLFCFIELKLLAAKIGFIRVELSGEVLALFFPPPEKKNFYEGEDAPFQNIVDHIHSLKQFHAHLKQDGKQLKLLAKITVSDEPRQRLDAIQNILVCLNPISS